jgi:hypothetical protein
MNKLKLKKSCSSLVCALLICTIEIGGMHSAYAQTAAAAPCAATDIGRQYTDRANLAKDFYDKKIEVLDDAQRQGMDAALNCLQRMKDILALISAPSFPDLTLPTMAAIMAFLAEKACKVVLNKTKQLIAPALDLSKTVQDQIDAQTRSVNGALSGQVGQNVLSNGSRQTLGGVMNNGYQTGVVGSAANAAEQANNSGVMNRLGCAFGGGTNCGK